ncbi:MAG TPA: sulfotransferase family 2 domain-containing protein [Longimicrobium sp.]|nr:sulfotransferase family 2 domain-containing protein [Longimicrobium sp.]
MAEEPVLVFLHIPKTAGTTLRRIIRRQYPRGTVWETDSNYFPPLTPAQYARLRVVQGHLVFGIHERLPRPVRYITLLRHPVERTLSAYYYIRRRPRDPLHALAHRLPPDEFAAEMGPKSFNYQTRFLSGHADDFSPAALPLALRNLEGFAAFGLDSRFDESLLLFRRVLGWRNVHYRAENVTRRRPGRGDLPARVIAGIERLNPLDMELYAEAERRVEARIAALGPAFRDELRAFRRRNAVYAAAAGAVHRVFDALPAPARDVLRSAVRIVRPVRLPQHAPAFAEVRETIVRMKRKD